MIKLFFKFIFLASFLSAANVQFSDTIDFKTQDPENEFASMIGYGVRESEHGRWIVNHENRIELKESLPDNFIAIFTGMVSAGNENKDIIVHFGQTTTSSLKTQEPWQPFTQKTAIDLKGEDVRNISVSGYSLFPAGDRSLGVMVEKLELVACAFLNNKKEAVDFHTLQPENKFGSIIGYDAHEPKLGRWIVNPQNEIELKESLPDKFVLTFSGMVSAGNENKDILVHMGQTTVALRTQKPWEPFKQKIVVDLKGEDVRNISVSGYSLFPAGDRSLGVMVEHIEILPYVSFE